MKAHLIDAGLDLLRCPVCASGFERDAGTLRCASGHSFDIARQGQVNLLGRAAPANADTPAMIAARERFLGAGHYAPIRTLVAAAAAGSGAVVEVGAGTGYYLAATLADDWTRPHLALDVSPAASRASAKAGLASAVADTWVGLPLASGSVERLLCIFAPRNPGEFARVLTADGELLIVTPTPAHLGSLRAAHDLLEVPSDKAERLDAELGAGGLRLIERTPLEFELQLGADQVADLIAMGPNAFHRHDAPAQAASTRASVQLSRYGASRRL